MLQLFYCKRCLYPNTKPYISFDQDGICGACRAAEVRLKIQGGIDWEKRKSQFEQHIAEAKEKKAPFYDVLVPVSGGKDSITQVHRLLGYDLRILAVHVDYGIKTEIGTQNLQCIPQNMGAHLHIYRPALDLHTKLIRLGYEDYGDPDLLSHTMLHGYPLRIALVLQVPLVLLGENSAAEYGGDESIANLNAINRAWFIKYAANAGQDARHVSKKYNISMQKLMMYDFPDELEDHPYTKTIFSSFYFHWDSEEHLRIAKQYGFRELSEPREGTYRTYVGIDEKINRIHQYFKVLKFGYGRATDHACEDIRNGRMNRLQAKELVSKYDLQSLSDDYIDDFCRFISIARERFLEIQEQYRNKVLWKRDSFGCWFIPGYLED